MVATESVTDRHGHSAKPFSHIKGRNGDEYESQTVLKCTTRQLSKVRIKFEGDKFRRISPLSFECDDRNIHGILRFRLTNANHPTELVPPKVDPPAFATGPLVRLMSPVGSAHVTHRCSNPRTTTIVASNLKCERLSLGRHKLRVNAGAIGSISDGNHAIRVRWGASSCPIARSI
jgi:hypothetical protein